MRRIGTLAAAATLALGVGATAQNTGAILTDGAAIYRIGGTGTAINSDPATTSSPVMDLLLAGGASDNLFNDWWWFRLAGDNREFAIASATSRNTSGTNSVTYGYDMGGLVGSLSYTLTQPSAGSARVDQRWRIANPTGSTITFDLFHYIDFDLGGSVSNTASLTTANERMMIENAAAGITADWWGVGASAYQVQDFPGLRSLLTNSTVDNFGNSGLPFGPDDFTGAYQWRLAVAPGGSVQLISSYGLNTTAIPAPGAVALLGLAGLAGVRRRR